MGDRRRRNAAPTLEAVEGRELMSGLLIALQPQNVPHLTLGQVRSTAVGHAEHATGRISALADAGGTNTQSVGGGLYNGGNNPQGIAFPSAPIVGTGTPTAAELARERFHARFSGPLSTIPGRFSDQKQIILARGLGGSTSNFFLHADYSIAIVIPTDRTRPTTGFAFLDDKNNNSGGVVGLDLVADPTSIDARGRPTRLTFTSDPNVYGGIFFVDASVGTVKITYHRNTATTVFDGRIYTSGLTSPFANVDMYAKHSG